MLGRSSEQLAGMECTELLLAPDLKDLMNQKLGATYHILLQSQYGQYAYT